MTPGFVFCVYCQSGSVDVVGWDPDAAVAHMRCSGCGHQARVPGFTIGRPYPNESEEAAAAIPRLVTLAALDMAIPPGKRGVG